MTFYLKPIFLKKKNRKYISFFFFLKSDDAYVDLNTLGEAINRVKRPLGTRRAPGQHCQHIKLKNPDFRNGMTIDNFMYHF